MALYQVLAASAQLRVQPAPMPGMEVTLLPERAGEGREGKSRWAGAGQPFFQALSFVLNLAVVAMSRLVLGSSAV